jgi:hypothetical protein
MSPSFRAFYWQKYHHGNATLSQKGRNARVHRRNEASARVSTDVLARRVEGRTDGRVFSPTAMPSLSLPLMIDLQHATWLGSWPS